MLEEEEDGGANAWTLWLLLLEVRVAMIMAARVMLPKLRCVDIIVMLACFRFYCLDCYFDYDVDECAVAAAASCA